MATIFVPPDSGRLNGSLINLDGSMCAQFAFPAGERFARLPDGTVMVAVGNAGLDTEYRIYTDAFALLVTNTSLLITNTSMLSPIAHDYDQTFYVLRVDFTQVALSTLKTITKTGMVGGTTWTLPNSLGIGTLALSRDASIAYYGRNGAFTGIIYRYNLNTLSALGNLFTGVAGDRLGGDLYVLADGSVLYLLRPATYASGAHPQTWELRHVDASGALILSIPVGEYPGSSVTFSPRFDVLPDESAIWIMGPLSGPIQQFRKFQLSDGAELDSFQLPNRSGNQSDLDGAVSECCPLILLERDCEDEGGGDDDEDDEACPPSAPTIGCWTPGTPSFACVETFTGPSRASCWGTFSTDAFRVGVRDS